MSIIKPNNFNHRIAFVAGVYRHFYHFHLYIMKVLMQRGFEIHAFGADDYSKVYLQEAGVICHDLDVARTPVHAGNWRAFRTLYHELRLGQYAFIHVHTPIASVITRIAAAVMKIRSPIVYTSHGFYFMKRGSFTSWVLYYPLERLLAKWTDVLITINLDDLSIAKRFHVRRSVYYVPGVGVDRQRFSPSEKPHQLKSLRAGEGEFVILAVGELNRNKNHEQLIRAVDRVRKYHPDLKCLIVGAGSCEKQLKAMVQRFELSSIVKFLGQRQDVPELMRSADVITLFSKREGLPRALLEGMASGLPIVATDVRGNRDLTKHGYNGYLVPVNDIDGTVKALLEIISDPKTCSVMGQNSRTLSEQYDVQLITKNILSIYDEILRFDEDGYLT